MDGTRHAKATVPAVLLLAALLLFPAGVPGGSPGNSLVDAAETNTVVVDIPACQVETQADVDQVAFPGGRTLVAEEGRPQVPYWLHTVEYPEGEVVRSVILVERSGRETLSGLDLPTVLHEDDPEVPAGMKPGWYPEEIFLWRVVDHGDGRSTLSLVLYPFYYDPETREAECFHRYVFSVETADSEVRITGLSVDREVRVPEGPVSVDLSFENDGAVRDLVVDLAVRAAGEDAILLGLPLRQLEEVQGKGTFQAAWDCTGFPVGDYEIQATLRDDEGFPLDTATAIVLLRNASDLPPSSTPIPTWAPEGAPGIRSTFLIALLAGGLGLLAASLVLFLLLRRRRHRSRPPR